MKRLLIILLATMCAVSVTACQYNNQTSKAQVTEFRDQANDTSSLIADQPIPHYSFSQIRQNLIELENAQAKGVQTTSFFFNWGSNTPIKTCASIGAPIATTTQLTNPQEPLKDNAPPLNNGGGNLTVGQMDPNGIYTGDSSGTYVMCVSDTGQVLPSYWEGYVETEFGAATWDNSTHQIKDIGNPTFHFSK